MVTRPQNTFVNTAHLQSLKNKFGTLSIASCAHLANATRVCINEPNDVNEPPPTFQSEPLHVGHTSRDVASIDAARAHRSRPKKKPSTPTSAHHTHHPWAPMLMTTRRNVTTKRHTHSVNVANMLRAVAATQTRTRFPRSECPQHMPRYFLHFFDIIGTRRCSAKHTYATSHNKFGTLHRIGLAHPFRADDHSCTHGSFTQSVRDIRTAKTAPAITTLKQRSLF